MFVSMIHSWIRTSGGLTSAHTTHSTHTSHALHSAHTTHTTHSAKHTREYVIKIAAHAARSAHASFQPFRPVPVICCAAIFITEHFVRCRNLLEAYRGSFRVIWVLVWVVRQRGFPVCLFEIGGRRIWRDAQYVVKLRIDGHFGDYYGGRSALKRSACTAAATNGMNACFISSSPSNEDEEKLVK